MRHLYKGFISTKCFKTEILEGLQLQDLEVNEILSLIIFAFTNDFFLISEIENGIEYCNINPTKIISKYLINLFSWFAKSRVSLCDRMKLEANSPERILFFNTGTIIFFNTGTITCNVEC